LPPQPGLDQSKTKGCFIELIYLKKAFRRGAIQFELGCAALTQVSSDAVLLIEHSTTFDPANEGTKQSRQCDTVRVEPQRSAHAKTAKLWRS
jgi:hypothetical protein